MDGEKIVDAGTMLGMVKTDADGRAIADIDFPLMDEDYVADTDSSVETDKTETTGTPDTDITLMTALQPELTVPTLSELVNPLKIGISPVSDTGDDLEEAEDTESSEEPDETEESETPDTEEEWSMKLNSGDYFLKELSVSGSYYMDDEKEYPVHFEYKDQDTEVVAADIKAENTQTTGL